MSVRRIVQSLASGGSEEEERVLRTPTHRVEEFGDELQALIQDLSDTMWAQPICIGLAAPQIGVSLAVAVLNWERESPDDDLIIVNPSVVSTSGKKDRKRESCMSVWGLCGEVERREKLSLAYQDRFGATRRADFQGFGARVVAHEVEHLGGGLYVDDLRDGAELQPLPIFDGLVNEDR